MGRRRFPFSICPHSPGRRLLRPGARGLLTRAACCAAAGALALAVSSCTSPVGRATRDTKRALVVRAVLRAQDTRAARGVRAVPGASAGWAARTVLSAWKAEMEAFYTASALGNPSYRPLGLGVVPGSPQDDQMISYLSAQAASGVVGPSTWDIGNMHVVSLGRTSAVVTACSYDPGSRFRSGDLAAPAALGGGAGLTVYITDMTELGPSWKLERSETFAEPDASSPGPCHRFSSRLLVGHATATLARAAAPATAPAAALAAAPASAFARAAAGNGGGAGSTGSSIWSSVWWLGSPLGPGPYTGGAADGLELCVWRDIGSSVSSLNSDLTSAGLPASFWTPPRGGGYPGIWSVDLWGAALSKRAESSDHFDLVACPRPEQVPPTGGDVESNMPPAVTATGEAMYLWIFWDTVPDPSVSSLPPLIYEALAKAELPSPIISTSPSSIDEFTDATIVNFPTWLWIDASGWRTITAIATGGGLVATVWATPMNVAWHSEWNFPEPRDDPEGGITFLPESLNLVCAGPGASYDRLLSPAAQATACESIFTQSTFGTYQPLEASISWQVNWALSDDAGVVGGEGLLADSVTSATRPLRVLQVESVITQG